MASPTAEMAAVSAPIVVMQGAQTWPVLDEAARRLADQLPSASHFVVATGEGHTIDPTGTAEAIRRFGS